MSIDPTSGTSSSNFDSIFNTALDVYKKLTKQDLASHPLLPRLQTCDSPDAMITIIREQILAFNQSTSSDNRLTKLLIPTINVLYAFSATVGQAVGLVSIGVIPVDDICSYIPSPGILSSQYNCCGDWGPALGRCHSRLSHFDTQVSQAAKDVNVSASQDTLINLFSRIEYFFKRLEIYTSVPPTSSMTNIIVEIMVGVISFLAIATKEIKQGRASKLMLGIVTILG